MLFKLSLNYIDIYSFIADAILILSTRPVITLCFNTSMVFIPLKVLFTAGSFPLFFEKVSKRNKLKWLIVPSKISVQPVIKTWPHYTHSREYRGTESIFVY